VEDIVVFLTGKVFTVSFSTVSFKQKNTAQVTFAMKPQMKINSSTEQKHWYLIHTWSDKALKIPLWIGHC